MAAKKLTIGQKREQRQAAKANVVVERKPGGDRIDALMAKLNKELDGIGRLHRGSEIEQRSYERRSTGIPSLDYCLGGGLPKGGVVEFGGEYSCGKTTACLHVCAHTQRTERAVAPTFGAVFWAAIEPFSKRWARENGYFIPFSERLVIDPETGEEKPLDPFAEASALELFRMEQAGITDPYEEITPFVLLQDERGDALLDAVVDAIRSNLFSVVVVDSLGLAKPSKWLEEQSVRDSSDFDRSAKMIGDYTARALLGMNGKFDENNMSAKDGLYPNQTSVINIQQIVTKIGTQARAPWNLQTIKGGEGSKHNHHAIMFFYKGQPKSVKVGDSTYVYGQELRMKCIKSKIGAPFRDGNVDFYFADYGAFRAGDFDVAADLLTLAVLAGTVQRSGSHYSVTTDDGEEVKLGNGQEAAAAFLRENLDWFNYINATTQLALRKL